MSKGTKVPVMKNNQQYVDWKKELQIWKNTNTVLQVDKQIQAGILFESLEGIPRQTVLSELSVSEITDVNGFENIIRTLDEYFVGNETQNAYTVIDELLQFKCEKGSSIENFIIEFQLKVNKVKASGTTLSDGVLGYALLNAANLPDDKHSMIKATCDELTYKVVKCQLEKIGFTKSGCKSLKLKNSHDVETSKVKVESCYYSNTPYQHHQPYDDGRSSSDEDPNGEKVYYSQRKRPFSGQQGSSNKPKLNPVDRFGHVRACTFCKCLYHWLVDCPYAPIEAKSSLKSNERPNRTYSKPL